MGKASKYFLRLPLCLFLPIQPDYLEAFFFLLRRNFQNPWYFGQCRGSSLSIARVSHCCALNTLFSTSKSSQRISSRFLIKFYVLHKVLLMSLEWLFLMSHSFLLSKYRLKWLDLITVGQNQSYLGADSLTVIIW